MDWTDRDDASPWCPLQLASVQGRKGLTGKSLVSSRRETGLVWFETGLVWIEIGLVWCRRMAEKAPSADSSSIWLAC